MSIEKILELLEDNQNVLFVLLGIFIGATTLPVADSPYAATSYYPSIMTFAVAISTGIFVSEISQWLMSAFECLMGVAVGLSAYLLIFKWIAANTARFPTLFGFMAPAGKTYLLLFIPCWLAGVLIGRIIRKVVARFFKTH